MIVVKIKKYRQYVMKITQQLIPRSSKFTLLNDSLAYKTTERNLHCTLENEMKNVVTYLSYELWNEVGAWGLIELNFLLYDAAINDTNW